MTSHRSFFHVAKTTQPPSVRMPSLPGFEDDDDPLINNEQLVTEPILLLVVVVVEHQQHCQLAIFLMYPHSMSKDCSTTFDLQSLESTRWHEGIFHPHTVKLFDQRSHLLKLFN
jgi:hypothetical protein